MQPYRHPHGPQQSTDDGRPVDLYGLPALPPDEPAPRPAPWQDRRAGSARFRLLGLGVAGGAAVAAASAAVGTVAVEAVVALL